MALICTRITRYEVLSVLFLGIFNFVCGQFSAGLTTREVGQSVTFTCPGDVNKNYTYTFSKGSVLVKSDARIKQDGQVLTIQNLNFLDSGLYSCSFYDENGNKIGGHSFGYFVVSQARTYTFEIWPSAQTSLVDEGESFKFRCEYSNGLTEMQWLYTIIVDDRPVTDYLPRSLITVLTNDKKSIEEYSIESVTTNNTGTYRCELMERGKKRVSHARVLQVRPKKAPVFQNMASVYEVKSKNRIKIFLDVKDGVPSANFSCYHEDRLLISCSGKEIDKVDISKDHSLPACSQDNYDITGIHGFIIKSATLTQNDGMYKCEASNIMGSDTVYFRVNVTAAPTISARTSQFPQFAEQSTEGRVICTINLSNPRPKVIWSRQDLIHPDDNFIEGQWTAVSDDHTSTLFQTDKGRYESKLTVPYNQKQSFYRCFAENEHGNDSRVFKFIRYGKGKKLFSVTPTSAVMNERKTFMAKCRILNVITGNIGFYRNDTLMLVNDSRTNITFTKDGDFYNVTMMIKNLTVNDSGTYRCSQIDVLTNDYAAVTLTVKALRRPVILDLQNKTVNQHTSQEAVLFCNVTGNPFPKVTWLRNGKPTGATLVRKSCLGQKHGYYYKNEEHTKLVICESGYQDTGFHTCAIENQVGRHSKDVFLNVTSWPMFETQSLETKQLNPGERFTKSCKVDGNPTPWVQWILKNENRAMTNISEKESTLEIHEMDEHYVGNYTCVAWNSLKTEEKYLLQLELVHEDISGTLPGGSDMSTGSIAGIVIGVFVLIIVIFVLLFLLYRRQQRKLLFYKHQYFLRSGEYTVDPSLTLNEQSMNLPYDPDWEFPFERLVLGERLGAGAFGEVYKGEAMGILALNPRDKSSIASKRRSKIRRSLRASQRPKKKGLPANLTNATVAVKTVKGQATESEIRDLAAELKLMIHSGEHKNIVNLLGACTTSRKLYVILEFCPYGNLLTFLRSKRDMYNSTWVKELYDPEKEFTLFDIVGAAYQVAKGMEFLASRKLIHRDLAARNILVANEYVMKISDFGLARDIYQNDVYVKTSSGMLPVKWMAVESLFDRVYTHQSDVWSFGVLLWEMMTLGGTPYPNLPAEQLLDFLNEGKRMPQPNKCPLEIYTIMRDCWQDQPEERPTFSSVVEHLGRILERHLEKANPYLHVEASPEEIEAAKEKEELLKSKSDYYLQPFLMSTKFGSQASPATYDPNAPLPTPPTDAYTEATAPIPVVDTKTSASKMKGAGSYELLRDDGAEKEKVPVDNEDRVGMKDLSTRNNGDTNSSAVKKEDKMESVV